MNAKSAHRRLLVAGALLASAALSVPCLSADLTLEPNGNVLLSGPIVEGDADRLIALQQRSLAVSGRPLGYLHLSSPGGSVAEAAKLGALVEVFRLIVDVPRGTSCASSCFFVFVAAEQRFAMAPYAGAVRGKLGLHRPYLDPGAIDTASSSAGGAQRALMWQVKTYLSQRNVPQRLIDLMMTKSSRDIYWANDSDIVELGSFSPAHEEMVIAKCGRTPDSGNALASAKTRQEFDEIAGSIDQISACDSALVRRLQAREVPDLLSRMKTGWRPW